MIAPVVAYLCHEENEDNGAIIESAAGWATKVHFVRGEGAVLRTSLHENVTLEFVRDVWSKVTDMSNAKHLDRIAEASGSLMGVLEKLDSKTEEFCDVFTFGPKDCIIYALGLGVNVSNTEDLKFLYENHEDFTSLPTYFIQPGLLLSMGSGLIKSAFKEKEFDLTNVSTGSEWTKDRHDT